MSINAKTHLKGIDDLYKKVRAFESGVKLEHTYSPVTDSRSYREKDIDEVMAVFSESLNIVPEELALVKNAMQSGELDLMSTRFSETLSEEESSLLYMVSRPFFKSMKRSAEVDNIYWEEGKCPVCNAVPSLSVIEKESKRKYFCSFCGTAGYYARIGCPNCLTDDPRDITVITLDGEEGMRADTCDKCMTYCKTFEGQLTADNSLDDLDILSLPLDIVVQEKGYKRLSPNPVGMMRMT
jgi:FdhE protein